MPNESAKIILAVTHGKLTKVKDAFAVEGTINALKVGFQFRTPDWDNTTKTVVFVRGRATPATTNADTTYVMLDENNECYVPSEILNSSMFSVGVFGTYDDYRIVSNWMCYKITDGCYADGSTPIDPSSTIYEQIISILKNKSDVNHKHDERYYTKDQSNDKFLTEEDLPTIPVTSVNQKTGDVVLSAADVGALPSSTVIPSIDGLATEKYVDTKVANIVSSAPETLDTLNELAAALGNDPNFATTVVTQMGNKIDKVNPTGEGALSINRSKDSTVGYFSAAIGYDTVSSGTYSFAEGRMTKAIGDVSHAEGDFTLASSNYQHVEGKYNVEDANGVYAHIVGNGSSSPARANAHTLDWDGNAWFAGDIKVGGTGQDDVDAKTIATKEDIDASKPKSATITLLAANWVGDASPYSQVVTIADATANTMIDLLPTPAQLAELQANEITLMMVNDDGVVTAYALNAKPIQDYEIPMVITETR